MKQKQKHVERCRKYYSNCSTTSERTDWLHQLRHFALWLCACHRCTDSALRSHGFVSPARCRRAHRQRVLDAHLTGRSLRLFSWGATVSDVECRNGGHERCRPFFYSVRLAPSKAVCCAVRITHQMFMYALTLWFRATCCCEFRDHFSFSFLSHLYHSPHHMSVTGSWNVSLYVAILLESGAD